MVRWDALEQALKKLIDIAGIASIRLQIKDDDFYDVNKAPEGKG